MFGYARVSSEEQAKGHSIDSQIERLKHSGCTLIFEDTESAYKKTSIRPGFQRLVEYIQSGAAEGDRLVVCNFERLARNELVSFQLFELLEAERVGFLSLDQPWIDLTTPDGRVMAGQQVIESRAYSARLSRKVKQGHQKHRDKNLPYFAPFGYQKLENRFVLDTRPFLCLLETQQEMSRAAVARDLVEAFLDYRSLRRSLHYWNQKYGIKTFAGRGKGNKQPRDKLGFHPSSLTSWLNNPILQGHLCYGRGAGQRQPHKDLWDIRYNTHSGLQPDGTYDQKKDHRLMTAEEYEQIEDVLDWNAKHGGYSFTAEVVHPLSGLVYCGECRGNTSCSAYRLRTNPDHKTYSYQCNSYRRVRSCSQKRSVREDVIEPALIDALCTRATVIADLAQTPDQTIDSPELQSLRSELQFYQSAPGSRAQTIIAELHQQIAAIKQQQSAVSNQQSAKRELLLSTFSDRLYWQTLQPEEKRDLYRHLCDRIVIRDGGVESVLLKV